MGFFASLTHYDWERMRQDCLTYDQMIELLPFNFEVDDKWFRYYTCNHCKDEFDGDKSAEKLVNHLKNNHLGEIVEKEEDW